MSQEGIEGLLVPRQPPMGWARLREKLRDEKGWIYRGQRSASWMLASTLERAFDQENRAHAESDLVYRYQQALPNDLPAGLMPTSQLDLICSITARPRACWTSRGRRTSLPILRSRTCQRTRPAPFGQSMRARADRWQKVGLRSRY